MTIKSDDRNSIVAYRLEKAYATLNEVKAIANLGFWTLAANRLYYAAYYASAALLINSGIEVSSHKGAIKMISLYFVKERKLIREDSTLLARLFSMRQTGDYDDLYEWTEKDIIPLIPSVEDYISRVAKLIENPSAQ
ncbi:MAG: HEPN domain-containing protein [Muribaculaceae bacterium]|nr:HEPN domain-containing protein [Muribaculaceae bacterium]